VVVHGRDHVADRTRLNAEPPRLNVEPPRLNAEPPRLNVEPPRLNAEPPRLNAVVAVNDASAMSPGDAGFIHAHG